MSDAIKTSYSVIAGQTHSIQLFRGEVELIPTDVYRALFFDAQTFYPLPY